MINSERDKIFDRAVPLDENKQYCNPDITVSQKTKDEAFALMETLLHLAANGDLDAMDLKIIEALNCSPMPSMREVAKQLNISEGTVRYKITHIKALIPKRLYPKTRK